MSSFFPVKGSRENDVIKRWMQWMAGVLACVAMLAACGGGGGSPGSNPNQGELSVGAVTAVKLMLGEGRSLPVSGGVPPYRVVSAEQAIAVATLDGNRLILGGQNAGSTRVTVSDYAGKSVQLDVTVGPSVSLYTTAPAALSLGVGPTEARTFRVAGGVKPYVITGSAPLVAKVTQLDAEQWRIEGVAIGDMKVSIRDAAGSEISIAVTVGSPEFRISSDKLSVPVGTPATVVLSGGQKPYSVAGGIPTAIQVKKINESEFEILGLQVTAESGVDVIFTDATGKAVKTNFVVNAGTTIFTISPSVVTIPEASGTAMRFTVKTGSRGDIAVLSSDPKLVAISNIVPPSFNGDGTLQEFGSFVGTVGASACVLVDTDVVLTAIDALGSIGQSTVKIINQGDVCGEGLSPDAARFAILAPSSVKLPIGAVQTYAITGGQPPLVAVSSNPSVVTAQIVDKGRTLQVNAIAIGFADILVYDSSGQSARADGSVFRVNVVTSGGDVVEQLSVIPNAATGSVGDRLTFIVAGGKAPYTLTVNNPSIASVSPAVVGASGGTFEANLNNAGSTVVTIRDATGASISLTLTVQAQTPQLRLSPSSLEIAERTTGGDLDIVFNIYGGVGPYRVFSSNTQLVRVGVGTTFGNNTEVTGNVFTVRQLQQSISSDQTVVVTVIDATGASAVSTIRVRDN